MIVDDHALVRRMVRQVFEAEDLEVLDAANGAEGVQKAEEVKPSLIILDLSMPVMNGLDAARELKVLMPDVRLLMFTNNVGGMVEKEARCVCIATNSARSSRSSRGPDGWQNLPDGSECRRITHGFLGREGPELPRPRRRNL